MKNKITPNFQEIIKLAKILKESKEEEIINTKYLKGIRTFLKIPGVQTMKFVMIFTGIILTFHSYEFVKNMEIKM